MAAFQRAVLLLAPALVATAPAQNYIELLREGDSLPGAPGLLITRIDHVDVNNQGDWLIELDTDAATNDVYLLHNGGIVWQEGTSTGFTPPIGKEAGSFVDTVDINDAGDVMFITPVRDAGTTTNNGTVLVWNGASVIEAPGTPCNAPGLPAGTTYEVVSEAWQNNNGQLLVGALLNLPTGTANALLRVDLDGAGTIVSEHKLALEGETLTGPSHVTPIQGFSFSKGRQTINDNGECIWYVDDEHSIAPGSTLSDANLYRTDGANVSTLLYNEADPFPADPADVFDHFSTAEVDLNNSGDFVFSGFDRGPSADDSWLFKCVGGVIEVIAHEGDPVPASVPGAWLIAGAGFGGVVPMTNAGDVLWFLDWDDPDTTVDTGLMLNQELLLQEGVSMLGGLIIEDIPNSDNEIAMSDDGTHAILEVVLDNPAGDLDAVYLVEFSPTIGTAYCGPAVANSTGSPGELSALGSATVSANDVTLSATALPPNQFGFFLNSLSQGFLPNLGGGDGTLCLGSNIGRYNAQIFSTGTGGAADLTLDLTSTPTPSGPVSVVAGQTWNFQCWHRDNTPQPTSNLTNGVEIAFN